jgi:hypothetical protein
MAPSVSSLNIIRVIISPSPAHASRVHMVRHDFALIRELSFTDATLAALENGFSVEQLSRLRIGAAFTIPSRMKWIFDSTDAELSYCLRLRSYFPSAAETRTMDGEDLVATESHDISPGCT